MPKNAWVHVAAVKNGTNLSIYQNGTSVASATQTATITDGGKALLVGWQQGQPASTYWDGYISNYRLVKSTALYTSNFTPPTAPLTAITNTSLLLNGTNAGIFDNAIKNNLETLGNAQVSTSVVKYGTGSMKFDGTGDYLISPVSPLLDTWTGNGTFECWVYFNSVANSPHIWNTGFDNNNRVTLYVSSSRFGLFMRVAGTGSVVITSSTTLVTGQFYHIAVTKNGTTWTMWLNGVSQGTSSSATYPSLVNQAISLGFMPYGGSPGDYFNGYIDDLRVTKGIARYTAAFTPPTAAFPDNS
jgi:hypothetical protein